MRPVFIENLSDECKEATGIDETLLLSSELDLDGALRKVRLTASVVSQCRHSSSSRLL